MFMLIQTLYIRTQHREKDILIDRGRDSGRDSGRDTCRANRVTLKLGRVCHLRGMKAMASPVHLHTITQVLYNQIRGSVES